MGFRVSVPPRCVGQRRVSISRAEIETPSARSIDAPLTQSGASPPLSRQAPDRHRPPRASHAPPPPDGRGVQSAPQHSPLHDAPGERRQLWSQQAEASSHSCLCVLCVHGHVHVHVCMWHVHVGTRMWACACACACGHVHMHSSSRSSTPSPHVLRARQAPRAHSPPLPSAARQAVPSAKALHGASDTSATAGWWQVLGPAACCRTQCGRHEA